MTSGFSHSPHQPGPPIQRGFFGKILLLSLFLITGFSPPTASARILTDLVGRKIDVPENPQRVIALAPSLTEIIFLLNEDSRLKGATRFSTVPEAARALPRAVLDANIYVADYLSRNPRSPNKELFRRGRAGEFALLASKAILEEVVESLPMLFWPVLWWGERIISSLTIRILTVSKVNLGVSRYSTDFTFSTLCEAMWSPRVSSR